MKYSCCNRRELRGAEVSTPVAHANFGLEIGLGLVSTFLFKIVHGFFLLHPNY